MPADGQATRKPICAAPGAECMRQWDTVELTRQQLNSYVEDMVVLHGRHRSARTDIVSVLRMH